MFDVYLDRNKSSPYINESLQAVIEYLKKNNIKHSVYNFDEVVEKPENKIAIIWSMYSILKPITKYRDEVKKNYEKIITMESGYINRKIYRSVTWNEFGGLSSPFLKDCKDDRLKKINNKIKPMVKNNEGYILICGQVPWDRQLQFLKIKYNKWINNLIKKIKKKTQRKIVFRFHPYYLERIKKKTTFKNFKNT